MRRKIVVIFIMLACVLVYACSKNSESTSLRPKGVVSKPKINELVSMLSSDSEFAEMAKLTKEEIAGYSNKLKEKYRSGKLEKLAFTASPVFIQRMRQLQGSLALRFPALSQLPKADRQRAFKLSSIAIANKSKNGVPKISSCEDDCYEYYSNSLNDLENYFNAELYDIRWNWFVCAGTCPYPGELGFSSYTPRPAQSCVDEYNDDFTEVNDYVGYWSNEYLLEWYNCNSRCGS